MSSQPDPLSSILPSTQCRPQGMPCFHPYLEWPPGAGPQWDQPTPSLRVRWGIWGVLLTCSPALTYQPVEAVNFFKVVFVHII